MHYIGNLEATRVFHIIQIEQRLFYRSIGFVCRM